MDYYVMVRILFLKYKYGHKLEFIEMLALIFFQFYFLCHLKFF